MTEQWFVMKGDLPSFPFKVTTGEICTDCRTIDEAIELCNKRNQSQNLSKVSEP